MVKNLHWTDHTWQKYAVIFSTSRADLGSMLAPPSPKGIHWSLCAAIMLQHHVTSTSVWRSQRTVSQQECVHPSFFFFSHHLLRYQHQLQCGSSSQVSALPESFFCRGWGLASSFGWMSCVASNSRECDVVYIALFCKHIGLLGQFQLLILTVSQSQDYYLATSWEFLIYYSRWQRHTLIICLSCHQTNLWGPQSQPFLSSLIQ